MSELMKKLHVIMADTYALYLKTQNYHWHVRGVHFKVFHELFEQQYQELSLAVDLIAERILTLGHHAPATFKQFQELKTIQDGNSSISANKMVVELAHDHGALLNDLKKAMSVAQQLSDEGTANMLSNMIESHEKIRWMLETSKESD